MPQNRVVHQLLTGRKRKAQSIGVTRNDNAKDKSGSENSRLTLLSSTFSPQSLSRPLSASDNNQKELRQRQSQYKSKNSERQPVLSQLRNQVLPQNNHNSAWGTKVTVATNKIVTESSLLPPKLGESAAKTKPDHSFEVLPIFPDNITRQRHDLKQQSQKYSNRKQHRLLHRWRYRYLRVTKRREQGVNLTSGNGIEIRDVDIDVSTNAADDDNVDNEKLRILESLAANRQRKRQRSRKTELYSNTVPPASKNGNDSFAELLVRTFLEQRYEKKSSPSHTLSSSCSSPFDDPMLFPVLLLGVIVLCRVTEWYDQKREEEAFSKSPIVRDLVLWMKDRQERHTKYASESIVQKHLDALNRLAKFHESITDSHETSLRLSRQREDEEEISEQHRHNQRQRYFEAENTAKAKTVARGYESDPRHKSSKEYVDMYHLTEAFDDSLLQLRQRKGGERMNHQQTRHNHQQCLEVEEFATESNLKINHDSMTSKQDGEPQKMVETGAVRTTAKNGVGHTSGIDINPDDIGNKALRIPNILHPMTQLDSAQVTTLSSLSINSDDADQRLHRDSQFDDDNSVLMPSSSNLTKKARPSMTNPSSPKTNVVREKKQRPYHMTGIERVVQQPDHFQPDGFTMKAKIKHDPQLSHSKPTTSMNNLDNLSNLPSVLAPNDTETNSQDKATTVKFLANVGKKISKAKGLEADDNTTNSSKVRQSKAFTVVNAACSNFTSKPHHDQTVRYITEAKSITDNPVSASPRAHRFESKSSSIATSNKSLVEENKNTGCLEREDDNGDVCSDSSSNDMSQILLSQSQKHLPKSRRVTASPRILPENKARGCREQYIHYSKTDFSGQSHNVGYQRVQNVAFDFPSGKEKSRKRNNPLSSQKSWMSRAPKRSPSFKQTSLTPSAGGWVSNQRARNFVNNKSSPTMPAIVVTKPTSDVLHGKGNIPSGKGDFFIQKDDGKDKTPLRNATLRRNDGFEQPTRQNYNAVEKMPSTEFPSLNSSALERKNPTARRAKERLGSQSKGISNKDNSNGSNDFDISSKGAEKVVKNDEFANNFRYEEVVRGKAAREALTGYECVECAAFFDEAVLHGDGAKYYDRDELLRCSRHRALHTPPQTPEDYWELSFMDEKRERLQNEAAEAD
jgi:hypothetical protein